MKETLRLDVSVPLGTCCICRMPPVAERLDLGLKQGRREYRVTICRHCISEHAPELLAELEPVA